MKKLILGIDIYIKVVYYKDNKKTHGNDERQLLTAEAAAGTREGTGSHRRNKNGKGKKNLQHSSKHHRTYR